MAVYLGIKRLLANMSGPWLIFLGALCWSTAGGIVKSFETDALLLAGIRSLLGGLILSPALRPKKIRFDRWLLLLILFSTGLMSCAIISFRLTSATLVIAMQYTAPIWLFFLSWWVNKRPDRERIFVTLLIAGGIFLFLVQPAAGNSPFGSLVALNMGICFAGVSVSLKRVQHDNAMGLVALMNLGSALIMLPLCLVLPGVKLYVGASDWLYIAFLAVFQLSAGYFFYMLGIKKVTPQKATLLGVWELVLTPVWAFLAVGEIPSLYVLGGSLLLMVALFLDNRVDSRTIGLRSGDGPV